MKRSLWPILVIVCAAAVAQENVPGFDLPAPNAPVPANPTPATVQQSSGEEVAAPSLPMAVEDPYMAEVQAEIDKKATGAPPVIAQGSRKPVQDKARADAEERPLALVLQTLVALCLVLGAIVALGYLARKFGKRTPLLAGAGMAEVLGKVYLDRHACLHFVRTNGKVLIIGVAPQNISLVAEFDAAAFAPEAVNTATEEAGKGKAAEFTVAASFLNELRASSRALEAAPLDDADDPDIASLRGDLQRLQKYVRESSSESAE